MGKFTFFPVTLIFIGLTTILKAETSLPGSLTLSECYQAALKQNESVAIQSEKIIQFEERYKRARGAIFPDIRFIYTQFYQDPEAGSEGGVGGTLTRSERPEGKFNFRQPLFSGFREYAAASSIKAGERREQFLLERIRETLFRDVAEFFYRVVRLETDLGNVRSILFLTNERIRELESRVRLGKSRRSELLSVESQLNSLQAQEEFFKAEIASAREDLSLVTGSDVSGRKLQDDISSVKPEAPLEDFLKSPARKDLLALQQEVESRRKNVKVAKGGIFPTIDAVGNYYVKRVGFQEGIDWDILFTLDFPIFQGGMQGARVRESHSELREAELNLRRAERLLKSEIKKSYANLQSSIAQAQALEKAYKKSEESYRLQVQEYRYGLVNNLEVLQVMNAMQETHRNYERALIQTKLDLLQLGVAAGRIDLNSSKP